jgi:hypothetical protein
MKAKKCLSCGRVSPNPDARHCGKCGSKLRRLDSKLLWRAATGLTTVLAVVFLVGLYQWGMVLTRPHMAGGASSAPPAADDEPTPASRGDEVPFKLETEALHRTPNTLADMVTDIRENRDAPDHIRLTLLTRQPLSVSRIILNGRDTAGCEFDRDAIRTDLITKCQDANLEHGKAAAALIEVDQKAKAVTEAACHVHHVIAPAVPDCGGAEPCDRYTNPYTDAPASEAEFDECWTAAVKDHPTYAPGVLDAEWLNQSKMFDKAQADCVTADPDKPWPQTLHLGEAMIVNDVNCGERILTVTVLTDQGTATQQQPY